MKQRSLGQQLDDGASVGSFRRPGGGEVIEQIYQAHGHVIPVADDEHLGATDPDERVIVLQQRALEAESARRRALEVALRDALAREAAAAEVGARYHEMFTGMLGHDLRNPLGAVMMNADYIARLNLGDKPTRNASRITACAARMSRMIDQLLDFTRIWVGGGVVLAASPVELTALCARVRDELEADHPTWSIAIEAVGDTTGRWDEDGLWRVLSNLVGNAITHGTGACHVGLRLDGSAASELVVEVHNEGVIAPRIAATLFEPRGGDKPRHKSDGLGLGLFISKQIIDAHAGTITICSTEPQGTTVRVTLPRPVATERGVQLG